MQCPKCKLENPPGGARCDCGYDFASGKVVKPESGDKADGGEKRPWLIEGAALLLLPAASLVMGSAIEASRPPLRETDEWSAGSGFFEAIAAQMLATLLLVAVTSPWKVMRNRRNRAKLILGAMLFYLVLGFALLLRPAA
jgi:hypothetical protein